MRFRRRRPKSKVQRIIYQVNQRIPYSKVRVIDEADQNLGVLNKAEALKKAYEAELDLVVVAEKANPPVAKILDFKKFLFEQKREQKHAHKSGKKQEIKELRLGFNISEHDLEQRINRAKEFLKGRDKVKFTVVFKGREITRRNIGLDKIKKIIESLTEVAEVEKQAWWEGKRVMVLLKPK